MIGAKDFMRDLPPREAAVFWLLRREQDVRVDSLYARFRIDPQPPTRRQQAVGAVITRLNRRLEAQHLDYIIKPGAKRRTYRLYVRSDYQPTA